MSELSDPYSQNGSPIVLPAPGKFSAPGTRARSAAGQPVERAVCEPGLRVPVVGKKAQAEHGPAAPSGARRYRVRGDRRDKSQPMIAKRSGYLRIASIANSFESGSYSTGWIRARSTPAASLAAIACSAK